MIGYDENMLPPIVNNASDALSHLQEHGLALIDVPVDETHLLQARDATYAAAKDDRHLGREADRFGLDYGEGNTRVWNILNRDPVFSDIVALPIVVQLLKEVLGWPALLGNISANIAQPGSEGGMWHQDQLFVPKPWPDEPQGMNFSLLLDDFTAENGATEVIPGSHLKGDDSSPDDLITNAIPVIAPAGTLMVFESRLWHRTGSNHSDNPRAALFGWYTKPIYRTQENWFLSLDAQVVDDASETLLALLGYKSKGLGLVYGKSPR